MRIVSQDAVVSPRNAEALMERIHSSEGPAPIGPYSQAIRAGNLLFTSGMIALDAGGEIRGDDAASQAQQALHNLEAVLRAGGASFDRVVKTTIYLADMNDFTAVNEVYAKALGENKPARSTVAVKTLPRNVLVEIDAIAVL